GLPRVETDMGDFPLDWSAVLTCGPRKYKLCSIEDYRTLITTVRPCHPFRRGLMKISDVTLTLFAWDDIPPTSYAAHTGKFAGSSKLGLLKVETDEGITGHAFLGSAYYGADLDGPNLIKYLKPALMGQDPLDRERLYHALWRRARTTTVRTIGACDVP